MSETHFQTTSRDILNLAATSLSAAPGLTEAERTTRSQAVIRGALDFQPADSAQTVLCSLIMGHHLAIMDGFRDIACLTLTPAEAARARTVIVAQTKLVLQLLREMRIERAEALARPAVEAVESAPPPAADAAGQAPIAKLMSAYTESLAILRNTDTLTPAAAAKARDLLSQTLPSTLFPLSGQKSPVPEPVVGSRAQRRAIMKRNGAFKRSK
jgi:hypothetical protein